MLQDCFVTRRQFVGAAAATASVVVAVPAARLLFAHLPTPYRAIYDERFEAARRFATDALSRGWATRAIRGDVTQVWFHDLSVRWKKHGPAPIAGLTTPASLFVLERLSWDVGMRVTARDTDTHTPLVQWLISLPGKRGYP